MWLNFDVVTARPDGWEDWDASRNESTNTQSSALKQCGYVSASSMATMFEEKGDAVQPMVDIFSSLTHHCTDWLSAFWLRITTSSLSPLPFCLHTPGYIKYDRSTASSQVYVHDFHIFHLFKTCQPSHMPARLRFAPRYSRESAWKSIRSRPTTACWSVDEKISDPVLLSLFKTDCFVYQTLVENCGSESISRQARNNVHKRVLKRPVNKDQ